MFGSATQESPLETARRDREAASQDGRAGIGHIMRGTIRKIANCSFGETGSLIETGKGPTMKYLASGLAVVLLATPALAGDVLILRGDKHLFAIAERKE